MLRHRLLLSALLLAMLAATPHGTLAAETLPQPNVIFFMADDMGMGDTSAYQDLNGNNDTQQLSTPQMERLARMGVRFSDAHTPASRCTPTRYALLTGRDPWRTRLKHFVLFGSQGDPLIEADRPTLGTLFQSQGYRTGLVGKWHVGLRYRQADGNPATAWLDADLTQPLFDCPLDHGFDFARYTSRSHGTSGPSGKPLGSSGGPGHLDGRMSLTATGPRTFATSGENAYVFEELGARHSNNAIAFLSNHQHDAAHAQQPFFLYYPSNSNHGPHTPTATIGDEPVAGAGRMKDGSSATRRLDYVYENDVALGRLLDWLESHEDPRRPGHRMIENTVVIFTSDNGAERSHDTCTGPFRSNKASCYEGGHRVPFIVAWPAGGVGDGNGETNGITSNTLLSLTDMYATFSEILGISLPDLAAGEKGAEDSQKLLAAWKGEEPTRSVPLFVSDHKEARAYGRVGDPAVLCMRVDDPVVDGQVIPGQWKVFFGANLLRRGIANPRELYNLATDPREEQNLVKEHRYRALLSHLSKLGDERRTSGGHRLSALSQADAITFTQSELQKAKQEDGRLTMHKNGTTITLTAETQGARNAKFSWNAAGLGISSGKTIRVDAGESIVIEADRDVIVESIHLFAGEGQCGGFYRIGESAPLSLYCSDADVENEGTKDQTGIMHDFGILKAGKKLRLDASPFLGVEAPGSWTLKSISIRPL